MAAPTATPILSVQETKDAVDKGTAIYVDVRTPEEFAEGHVPGSVNIPVKLQGAAGPSHDALEPNPEFVAEVEKAFPKKDKEIILACGAGRRAAHAADLLSAAGFSGLQVFKEGWTGWTANGLPVEKK